MLPARSDTPWLEIRHSRVATLAQKWQGCKAYSYYTVNRLLLLSIGLWPYQECVSRRIAITLMTVVLVSSVVFQLTTFVTIEYDVDVLLHVLAYSVPWLAYTLKYNVLCFNIKKIRDIMERVRRDWDELSSAQEIEIIKKHSAFGRFVTIATTLFIYVSICGIFIMLLISNYLLDVATAANESRVRQIPILVEYFVNQQKYYALILSHIFLMVLCGFTTVAATETLMMSYTHHACGLFEIANFRMEHALQKRSATRDAAFPVKRNSICGIISAVEMQKKAFTFIEMVSTSFNWAYMVILPLGITSMSVNLYRLSCLLTSEDYYELVISFVFVLGHLWYMIFCNYIGQFLVDQGNEMFYRIYNIQWYTASLEAQKLLRIVMQRTMRHCAFVIGGMFIPSFEGFARLTSMSISYFMVLLSVQDS